jgi:hypothetical protein
MPANSGQRVAIHLVRVLLAGAVVAPLGGCFPHQPAAMHGGRDGVSIDYAGDVAATLPIARQHCAQYERVPVLAGTKENTATYACVRATDAP